MSIKKLIIAALFFSIFIVPTSAADVPSEKGTLSRIGAAVLPIPSPDEYADFLLEPWKPNAPILVAFKDPFCPYCIKAFHRKSELQPYNVFMFWYPIFGERSERRIEEIFRCASPTSQQVINAVIAHQSPSCGGSAKKHLMALNRRIYEAYAAPGVPAYYLGGVKVSMAQVRASHLSVSSLETSVHIDWQRYDLHRLNIGTSKLANVLLMLPELSSKTSELMALLRKHSTYDWYLFSDGYSEDYYKICEGLVGKCKPETIKQYLLMSEEIKLLFGWDSAQSLEVVINGKILTNVEKDKYLPFLKNI